MPSVFAPERALFDEGFAIFRAEHLAERPGDDGIQTAAERLAATARALWLLRGRADAEPESEDSDPSEWDLARLRRRLERNLVQSGLLMRRARFLSLLTDANIAFRERDMIGARGLVIAAQA